MMAGSRNRETRKQDPGVDVSAVALRTAWNRWSMCPTKHSSFANFLGMTRLIPPNAFPSGVFQVRQSAANKIALLNSPHWFALLKAHQARRSRNNPPYRDVEMGEMCQWLKKHHCTAHVNLNGDFKLRKAQQ